IPILAGLLVFAATARAENDAFLSRDETVPAQTYLGSDGAEQAAEPSESPWETFVREEPAEPEPFELPGLFPILQTSPELQTLVVGPTFRNQKNRIEVGAGIGYINSRWRFPFELSIEPTYRRNKHVPAGQRREFARLRTFGLVELWDRASDWESTAFALTAFHDWQDDTFNALELGGSVTQSIGRRLSISGNLAWAGDWPDGGKFN